MNENKITCPQCGYEIDVEQAVASSIRREIESEVAGKYLERDREIVEREAALEQAQSTLDKQVAERVEKLREETVSTERARVRKEYEASIAARAKENEELSVELAAARHAQTELEQLKRRQELEKQNHLLELERARTSAARQAEETARQRAMSEYELKIAEKEKQIDDFRRQVSEWKQKAEQGSMQIQGEVQELALEQLLRSDFPDDRVVEVPKGIRGADCILEVAGTSRGALGTIIYESKRTKSFSRGWLEKLRDDQRDAHADLAVLVTTALPQEMPGSSGAMQISGVWVCSFDMVSTITSVLRYALVQVDRARETQQNAVDKATLLYEYLTGQEFRHQFSAALESLLAMKNSVAEERRAFEKRWKEREKQVDRAARAMAGMWGSIGGIAGGALPEMPEFRLIESAAPESAP